MERYPAYKNSGVPWLGDIPKHWNILRNKIIFKERKEIVGSRHTDYKLLSLTLNGIIYRDLENARGKFPADFSTYQAVYPDDLVFCFFDVDETPRTVGLSSLAGMITGAYTVLTVTLRGINRKYLYYYYLNIDNQKGLRPIYRGLRKTVPFDSFMASRMPVPPLPEQQQIARFLDWKTSKISKFIRVKKKLIALLKEQKQNIINQAVCKGINPHVRMKDSG
ncbi:MAG: restriction endonuclease subunit S, partial [Desulfococcaceae bacterium]|nr:restriction endonuclease subunit S [Desulfococcaceae bacterium]